MYFTTFSNWPGFLYVRPETFGPYYVFYMYYIILYNNYYVTMHLLLLLLLLLIYIMWSELLNIKEFRQIALYNATLSALIAQIALRIVRILSSYQTFK